MSATKKTPASAERVAPCNPASGLAEATEAMAQNPLIAAPESIRGHVYLFWQLIDEFLDSPKAIAILFGNWVENCGLTEEDAIGVLQRMSTPEELAVCKTKWDIINRVAVLAKEALYRQRIKAQNAGMNARLREMRLNPGPVADNPWQSPEIRARMNQLKGSS